MSTITRWSIVIVAGILLYTAALWLAEFAGLQDGLGRTLGVGGGVGLLVGGLAAALGLLGDQGEK